jgi:hypothetical protein
VQRIPKISPVFVICEDSVITLPSAYVRFAVPSALIVITGYAPVFG